MSTVRLTLQIWDAHAKVRLTQHCDVALKRVRFHAEELLKNMLLMFPPHESKDTQAKGASVGAQPGMLLYRNRHNSRRKLGKAKARQ